MTMETFMKAIRVVDYCVAKGTQRQLNLFGIGEPTLNPLLPDMIRIARTHLPANFNVHTNTNGRLMTEELAKELKDAGITRVDVTGHDPRITANAVRILRHHNIFGCISIAFMENPNDWAGQVDWFKAEYQQPCPYLYLGQVMIMWDGRITRCCMDAFARGVIGTVNDDSTKFEWKEYELCKTCHHIPPSDPRMNGRSLVFDATTGAVIGVR